MFDIEHSMLDVEHLMFDTLPFDVRYRMGLCCHSMFDKVGAGFPVQTLMYGLVLQQ